MKVSSLNIICFLFFIGSIQAQFKSNTVLVNDNFDIRKTAKEYFGNPDFWPYILKSNNLSISSELKSGMKLIINSGKVKEALSKLESADRSIQEAITIGAKVLAEDLLNMAIADYQKALMEKKNYDVDKILQFSVNAVSNAEKAIRQTKLIRDRSFDAVIAFKKGKVQKLFPNALKWQNAEVYENLVENDWARTLSLSLAKITFNDLNQIKLNENSQALIQKSRLDVLSNQATTKVKLSKGDAYAMLLNNPKKKFDLELKGVKTKINSKYFWVENGNKGVKFANYQGEIKIESNDSSVTVGKNEGSIIPTGGTPSKPKVLLPSPELLAPIDSQKITANQLFFKWNKIESASLYWLEIASDASFKTIISKNKIGNSTEYEIKDVENGVYYWRVCTVDSVGLPGLFSSKRTVIVASDYSKPFLTIENPTNNFITKDSFVNIKGKVSENSLLLINEISVPINLEGFFSHKHNLSTGKNVIRVTAQNKLGFKTEQAKIVYCFPDTVLPMILQNYGELAAKSIIITNSSILNFRLTTHPFTKLEITSLKPQIEKTLVTDSTGFTNFSLSGIVDNSEVLISAKSITGVNNKSLLKIVVDSIPPAITFDANIKNIVQDTEYILTGKLSEEATVTLNGTNQLISHNLTFKQILNLKQGNNRIEIKAKDKAGNVSYNVLNIIYDNMPPVLKTSNIIAIDKKKRKYKIVVTATDETQLTRTASAEVLIGNNTYTYILELDNLRKQFSNEFRIESQSVPKLISVILSDYLGNKKIYQLNN